MYKVELTYFKSNGTYYTNDSYETELKDLNDIWDEVLTLNPAPGLSTDGIDFIKLIDVPNHPLAHPKIIPAYTKVMTAEELYDEEEKRRNYIQSNIKSYGEGWTPDFVDDRSW